MDLDSGASQSVMGNVAVGDDADGRRPSGAETSAAHPVMRVRWLVWSVLALAYLIALFQRIAPGVVADRLMADFAVGGAAVGLLTSIYFYVYAAMQIPSGALADTLGARKTVAAGVLLAGIGSIVFGRAPVLEVAYLGRFMVGLGVSVIFIAVMKFQVNWFRTAEFGTVAGLLMVVGNMGSVTGTIPMAWMAQTLGWRDSFATIGVATCAIALVVWLWVRDRPSDLGLSLPWAPQDASRENRRAGETPATKRPFLAGAKIVWGNRQTQTGFLAHFGILGANMTFTGLWAVPYLMHVYRMDRAEAAAHLMATSMGILISAPLGGYVSDRLLRRRKLPIVALGMLACSFWLTLTLWNSGRPPVWALYPLFWALGFSNGTVTLVLAAVKESNPPELSGLAMGTANGSFVSAALLQPAMGYLLDSRWQGAMEAGARVYPVSAYHSVLAVLAGFALMGLMGALLMKETHCRNVAETRG